VSETTTRGAAPVLDLARLTSLRAFAALAVFGFHAGTAFDLPAVRKLFGLGYAGVGFLFILSGFVLTWATRPGTPATRFYRRRFARVYPAYLVSTVVAGIALGFGGPLEWVLNLFLVQAWHPSDTIQFGINGVTWSLACEAFFYLLWPVLAVVARRRLGVFAVAATAAYLVGAGFTTWAIAADHGVRLAYVNPALRLGEFLLGIVLAVLVQRGALARLSLPLALVALAVNWYLVRRFFSEDFPLPDYLMVPSYFLLVWAAATADLRGRAGVLAHPLLVYAGQVSFCFYLVHQFGIELVVHLDPGVSPMVEAAVALAMAAVFAAALHHLVEVPAQRALSGRRAQQTPVHAGHASSSAD
jgi:peptidoglycan/LPS O-acetylase OafA/YrhL